jgi:hypothetical protein
MKPKIIKTPHYKAIKKARAKAQAKKDIRLLKTVGAGIVCISSVVAFVGLMYISYPKDAQAIHGSALPNVQANIWDDTIPEPSGDGYEFYPPEYELASAEIKNPPKPKRKPEWIQENAIFQAQLEEALR